MNRVKRCLAEIRAIREVAKQQAVPYVARSRIGRLALTTVVLVAEEVGMPPPDLPGPIQLPEGASPQLAELAARCIRLADISRHIIQPSEPLADRWERGWHQLLEEIDLLEEQLRCRVTSG
jgi:hypothetical protein